MDRNSEEKKDFVSYLRSQWDSYYGEIDDLDVKNRIWKSVFADIGGRRRKIMTFRLKAAAIAASLFIAAFGGYFFLQQAGVSSIDREYVWIASDGEVQILPDGTKVWMEKGCTMSFYNDFSDNRQVWLQGNAIFEVTKMEGRNFRVNLKDSYVEVKGTCFSVRQTSSSHITVALYNGKVDFVSKKTENVVTLKPSQNIVYNTEDASILVNEFSSGICWSEGTYKMDKVSLEDLTKFLSSKYNVSFDCSSVRRNGKTLTGVIGYDESFETVLKKICYVFDIDYNSDGNTYCLKENFN